jgi:Sec-independent protein translocase protein TatA
MCEEEQMPNLGTTELAIIGVIILILFGGKGLKELGFGIRNFREALDETDEPEE